jgi:hypothetical protein
LRFFSSGAQNTHRKQGTTIDEAVATAGHPKVSEAGAAQSPKAEGTAEKNFEFAKDTNHSHSGWPSPFEGLVDAPPQATARFFERIVTIMKTLNITDDPANLLPVLKNF